METTLQRAIALQEEGKSAQALPLFEAAIREDPMNPDVWYHAGVTAGQLRSFKLSASFLQMYVRLRPQNANGWFHFGFALFGLGQYETAAAAYARVLELRPDQPKALAASGHLMHMLGRNDEAEEYYRRLLAHPADDVLTAIDKGLMLLGKGDYARGWPLFERRLERDLYLDRQTWRPPTAQHWRGEAVPDRTVCAYQHGGYGDTFVLARYLPMVAERAGEVLTATTEDVDAFVATVRGVTRPIRLGDHERPDVMFVDYWSLPTIFGTTLETVPAEVPYFTVPETGPRVERTPGRMLVGLVWAGSPNTIHDFDRSVPDPELLRPLLDVPGVDWVSLQVGDRASQGASLPIRACPALKTFSDTAHVLAQLDLVVTVDTSVANLAGALACPLWVMVPTWPEWRWPGDAASTPWFPTARLFRRRATSEWSEMVGRMVPAMRDEVATWRAARDLPAL